MGGRDGEQTAVWEGVRRGLTGARSRRVQSVAYLLLDQARLGDGKRLPLHLLIEEVLGLWLGQCVPVGYGLDGRVVPGGQPVGRADPQRLGGLADVGEDPPHRNGLGN